MASLAACSGARAKHHGQHCVEPYRLCSFISLARVAKDCFVRLVYGHVEYVHDSYEQSAA